MIYLNDGHIREIGVDWTTLISLMESTARLMHTEEIVQPLKPYLRFRHPGNRIIAMPAFVGGEVDICGIKWISSFPGNVMHEQGLPRAHCTVILNDPSTGAPVAFFQSQWLNTLRTAAVSGVMLHKYREFERGKPLHLGIIGWGPIGRRHLEMVGEVFGDFLESVRIFDIKGVDPLTVAEPLRNKTIFCSSWQEVYGRSNVFITCTAATQRYIDSPPSPGTLLLNVSLRDYFPSSVQEVKGIVVDDWNEVCRENTDIEQLHRQCGLQEQQTFTLRNVICDNALSKLPPGEPVFFNPMGMAAFDMTLAAHYWREAERLGVGVSLEN
ncbi:2,3-diaminopropionate biosynthesis protein SbnB [Cohnella silvisoli]|uniref:2,3-diaminopropionate biosynthesis protein SbnB n=1 Tax=Cohnella silvisoli TaxID=2873699 RepID=A0ABV1KRZ3_9BACL|nr:2,3-diaminopropionate biosynthesis protein SbnB [Cohnella silvisoli]MCD9022519.1 2,3-diaminopropionate biosynthesis protein SbnB [Cohnella silvisoli]